MKPLPFFSSLLLSVSLLIGCSAAGALNAVTPTGSYDRDKNIAYGNLARQNMDVYLTKRPRPGAPVIVFVYGGSWTDGKKSMYKFVAEGFTKEGYNVVVPNYRLFPEIRYPDMIRDTGLAIQQTAQLFPGQPLVLMGHSAGAYNVLMSAMAPEISGVDVCGRVSGVISLSGPTGAYPLTEEPYITIFPERFTSSDAPIRRASRPLPPILLVNGEDDTTVGPENAVHMADALGAAGKAAQYRIYPGMNHIDPVRVLSRHFDGGSPLKDDLISFIDSLPKAGPFCNA